MAKVSVIVAAYNIEKYIDVCMKSIMNQTQDDIEIIVVNDGSKDDTLLKIKYLRELDNRIIIVDKKNEGVSKARNEGLTHASGEYVMFIDGDDYIDFTAIELLYKKAKDEDADLVCYNYAFSYEDGTDIINKEETFKCISGDEYLKLCLSSSVALSLWSKLIRREFLIKHNIKCPENIAFAEDMATSIHLASYAKKVCKVDKCLYYYLQRNTSVTKTDSKKVLDILKSIEKIKTYLDCSSKYERFKGNFELLAFQHLYYYNVVTSNIIGESHKALYYNWKKHGYDMSENKHYKNFICKVSKNDNIRLKLYNINYNLGKSYVLACLKIKGCLLKK